jgi:hypothetical protein
MNGIAVAALTLLAQTSVTAIADPACSAAPCAAPAAPAEPPEEDFLLLETTLDNITLTDGLPAYASGSGALVPLGELTRLLDADVVVSPADGRATGTIGEARRPMTLDVGSRTARVGGQAIVIGGADVVAARGDLYVSTRLLEQLLPVRAAVDPANLTLVLTALERFPVQERAERHARVSSLRPEVAAAGSALGIDDPYRLFTMPSFDIAVQAATDRWSSRFERRYDVRAANDLFGATFQGYLGSDEHGSPAAARLLLERRGPNGGVLGRAGIESFSIGDTFTPGLPIGARSVPGRGLVISTAPVEQLSVFGRLDLRGELPIGYDIELYVNDVLRGGQQTPAEGRYEFLDVPLVRGVNVIRLVQYGPRGERSEQTRVVTVGGGQVPTGKAIIDVGVVQQDRPLVELGSGEGAAGGPGAGALRAVASIAYGVSTSLTAIAGLASYAPLAGKSRQLGSLGLRTSFLGAAVQLDGALQDDGGSALSVGAARTLRGVATVARHAEYGGRFIDEALPRGGDARALTRYSELLLDFSLSPGAKSLPISLRAERAQYADGSKALLAGSRASLSLGRVALSSALDFERSSTRTATADRLLGTVSASTYLRYAWALRGVIDYTLLPDSEVSAVAVTADRDIGERAALRFGLGHSLATRDTTLQTGAILRRRWGDLALTGDYATERNEWRAGLQLAFGLVFDPLARRYAVSRPGAARGGTLALDAFIDRDGDGRRSPADEAVADIAVAGGSRPVRTDGEGRAMVTGLAYGSRARLSLNLDDIDYPYATTPSEVIEVSPRPGRVVMVPYPIELTGEVMVKVMLERPAGGPIGLSAVRLRVVRSDGLAFDGATEFDGSLLIEKLPPGDYHLELDPAQAQRLKLRLLSPVGFKIGHDGGFAGDIEARVAFDAPAAGQ